MREERIAGEYGRDFYQSNSAHARQSACELLPLVLDIVEPRSVVDIGCGTGTWISVCSELGIDDVLGIDGGFCSPDLLEIPTSQYQVIDLALPFSLGRRFDMAICLEVAEHLPESSAAGLIKSLVELVPCILFSAAIPGQGGTSHLNEQWPDYWVRLFSRHEYKALDWIRPRIWNNEKVAWWYSQNSLLFCSPEALQRLEHRASELPSAPDDPLSLVHPAKLVEALWVSEVSQSALRLLQLLPAGSKFLLIDEGAMEGLFDGRAIRLFYRDGLYFGPPADDAAAIAETGRLASQADFLVVAPSAKWWLDFYTGWREHLSREHKVMTNDQGLTIFDLRV